MHTKLIGKHFCNGSEGNKKKNNIDIYAWQVVAAEFGESSTQNEYNKPSDHRSVPFESWLVKYMRLQSPQVTNPKTTLVHGKQVYQMFVIPSLWITLGSTWTRTWTRLTNSYLHTLFTAVVPRQQKNVRTNSTSQATTITLGPNSLVSKAIKHLFQLQQNKENDG